MKYKAKMPRFPLLVLASLLPGLLFSAVATRAQRKNHPRLEARPVPATIAPENNVVSGDLSSDLREFSNIPAVPGYEQDLAKAIRAKLQSFSTSSDNLGDIIVTIGSGSPHRLMAAALDEPGYVVSGITDDGYLRVQRLPQSPPNPLFDQLYEAQPVRIQTAGGQWSYGVIAGLSVHLQSGRARPGLRGSDLESMYIDVGASSAVGARNAGFDVLAPLAIERQIQELSYGKWAGAAIGDRFGAAALVEVLRRMVPAQVRGTLTIAFVTQQWLGGRGLARLLQSQHPDEMIYTGRLLAERRGAAASGIGRAPRHDPGSGVLLGLPAVGESLSGFPGEIKELAGKNKIPLEVDYSAPFAPQAINPGPDLPARAVHLGIATAWSGTPAELVDLGDLRQLAAVLEIYAQGSRRNDPHPASAGGGSSRGAFVNSILGNAPQPADILRHLVESYGVSGHEATVRAAVSSLLPSWAEPEADSAGNLFLHFGPPGPASEKTQRLAFVAHMDEIGFEVHAIAADGRLEVEWRGGGFDSFYAGHPALLFSKNNMVLPAIMELPDGWDQPNFEWPHGPRQAPMRVDVGARSPQEVAKLGIAPGDWLTVPKKFRKLAGTRVNARSFDDRVGCAALISAVWALGEKFGAGRDVTFIFSTGEEVGLDGAFAAAQRLAAEGRAPDYVFAIDTFVSSDSPLESARFARAELGKGFVVRAVDSSNVVPRRLVERVAALSRANHIPVQYGVTGGGNDGSAFVRFGTTDIALGWPLRYSHSPAEVIDTRDLDDLTHITTVLARSW